MEQNNGNKKLTKVEVQLEILEKVIDRIDVVIDKLESVITDVRLVVANHESKIEQQGEVNAQFYEQIERLHDRISQGKDERIETFERIKKDIDSLNRWRWIIVGAATVGGFLISLVLQVLFYAK
jgi:septal ring factor EnvC (AmiA/AmiB activator)